MLDFHLLTRLDGTYNMLARLAEDDIRSAYDNGTGSRPVLPDYLDALYPHIIRAIELERDCEDSFDAVSDFDQCSDDSDYRE
jgi:hypothetical protein